MRFIESTLQESNRDCPAVADAVALLKKEGFPKDQIASFVDKTVHILDQCAQHHGVGTRFLYTVSRRMGRVRLRIMVQAPPYNPVSDEEETIDSISEYVTQLFWRDKAAFVSYKWIGGRNVITPVSEVKPKKEVSFKSPMLWAIALGIICGLICQRLPDNVRAFLVDGLASPVGSVVLALIAGVTGPVIFLSLISSIISLGSVSKLTGLGFRIMWRFIKCTLFIIGVSIGVSLLFYSAFGSGSIQFSPDQLVSMLLKLVPTNLIAPFLNNNTPQLVILGLLLGAAFLLLEDRVTNLSAALHSLREWASSAMRLVFVLAPVIPFVSVFKAFADGQASILLEGWEFIVGVFLSLFICCLIKLVKVSLRCKISIPVLLKKALPLASHAFTTGSENATMHMQIEHARNSLGIR